MRGILRATVGICTLALIRCTGEEAVDIPGMGNRGMYAEQTFQVHRTPVAFQMESEYTVRNEDDITKNDTIVIFDKTKPKPSLLANMNSSEYIAPQRYEISQSTLDKDRKVSLHDTRRHEMFDPSSNQLNETPTTNAEHAMDNFGERYQHWNQSLFNQAEKNEREDPSNPYPPLPQKHSDEKEYFPPSFRQALSPEEPPKDENKQFEISAALRDSTRTTLAPNTSDRSVQDSTTVSGMDDYDNHGMLAKGEEIQYSDDPSATRQTYSTEGIKRDPTMPFKVTHSLMDSLNPQSTTPTTYLQDSEATIYPTLVPEIVENEEAMGGEDAVITSDYVSNLEPAQRDRMFSRDKLQPWEKYRNEEVAKNKASGVGNENVSGNEVQSEDANEPPTSSTASYPATGTSTPYYATYVVPASSIYAAPPPPLSSFILVPSGTTYYGDQAPQPQTVSNSAYGQKSEEVYSNQEPTGNEEYMISRENTVTVEKVGGSDLARSPQFKLYGIKTAFHKGSGTTVDKTPSVEKYDTWLANPATIFDLPLPTVLKTAFAVNSKVYSAKQHSDNSNAQNSFDLDESKNPLKYRKRLPLSTANIPVESLQELSDAQVVSGGSDGDEVEIESYIDEEALNAANKQACHVSELTSVTPELTEGNELLSQCFVMAQNCLLSNAAPIERRINLNMTECAHFCAEMQNCKSISYSFTMSICDVFAFQNGTSTSRLIRLRGYHYLQPTRKNIKKCLEDRRLSGLPVVASNDPIVPDLKPADERLLSLASKVNPSVKSNPCPSNTDIIMFKADHYRLRNFGIDKIEQDPPNSESECLFSCLIDLANGRLPFNCTSASFNAKTNECILYSAGSNVNGNGHLIEEKNFAHYEKACANVELVQQCRGFPIERIPQKIMIGFILSTEKASSLLSCINMCFERYKRHNDCLSVVYYYTQTDKNCIFSSESHQTAPNFFLDETEDTVDYASLDKCFDVKEDLIHLSTDDAVALAAKKPLAIDTEDGSRILPSTPGFDIAPTLDEKIFENDVIDGGGVVVSSDDSELDNEIRKSPPQLYSPQTSTITPELQRRLFSSQLRNSIKKLKL